MNKEDYKIAYENVMKENYLLDKEIDRLKTIISKFEDWLIVHSNFDNECSETIFHERLAFNIALQYLQELKEIDRHELKRICRVS